MTVPGFKMLPHPTSTKLPRMAPTFLRPVGIFLSPTRIYTNVLSDFTLEVIEPAPICDLYPRMESPT